MEESNRIIEIDGKKYTRYECTQMQRKLETKLRYAREEKAIYQAAGQDDLVREATEKMRILGNKYKEVSEKAGLPTRAERLRVFQSRKTVEIIGKKGIIISGARITDPDSKEAIEFAEEYYAAVRKRKTDYQRIAKNIGETEENVLRVKNYLFIDNSLYNEGLGIWMQFPPDCAIAQSWQRLTEGKDIKDHDIVLIKHELYELDIKNKNPKISHKEAHRLAEERYNYSEGVAKYYGNLKRHNKNK